ncbi:hypothetical protein GU926_07615 [Nibribacter ruber]|uniref:Uncharacterized protein n=1 Tax=Nibribacter ruber TaxID=2698458 RepID=A0A6P1NTV9_9BACT|nr:hypothetical protein [Nibribacter ruber]QHL87306.1 hypothetical protein GU926_07615 [Nibribacter ruber]
MKTKADITIPCVIIGYSCVFTLPLIIKSPLHFTEFGWLWIGFWSLVALFGIWKIEYYEITDSILTRRNFLGAFSTKRDLKNLIKYSKKNLDTDFPTNPFNIVKPFTNKTKYLKFQEIKLEFKNQSVLKIDERTVDSVDYPILFKQLKKFKTNC